MGEISEAISEAVFPLFLVSMETTTNHLIKL
jgi:hypothetical protein